MIAYEYAQYLAQAGFGTLGEDIYVGQIPSATQGLYVAYMGGEVNSYLPLDTAVLVVYAKYSKASEAVEKITDIKNHVHRMHTTNTANAQFYSMLVLGDIEELERDEEYAKLYKLTIEVKYRDLSLIS